MSIQSRKVVREEVGAILTQRLTTAAQVHTDQPTNFGGMSPVVVVASAGSEREGTNKRTFSGPVAPSFSLDVYIFVATVEKNGQGEDVTNSDADDELDTLEAAVAQFVSEYPSAQTWTALSYGGRTETEFVTILDGTEYKRERVPLVLTGR